MKDQISKTVRKSDMEAENRYDYGMLAFPREGFLACTLEAAKEEIVFNYEIEGYSSFQDIKKERRDTILIVLMDIAKLQDAGVNYKFTLAPDNLYYNIHNQLYVMERDVYGKGKTFSMEEFLTQYKALIGFALQKKYSYEDYYEGGMDLLSKDKFLSTIEKQENIETILQCLRQEYDSVTEMYQKTKVLVSGRGYKRNKVALWISSGLLLITCVLIGFGLFWIRPYDSAVIEANQKYLKKDYIAVIDAFESIKMERLSVFDKYILAYSFIQCESLTGEQKENIINALSLDTNEKVLDYWIYLGRLDTAMAEDIAQQISDNDLLLYAYLKDKNIVEEDRVVSGSEKERRLEELQGKIDKISESFIKTDTEDELDVSDSDFK